MHGLKKQSEEKHEIDFGNYRKKHVEEWFKIVFVNVNSSLLADDRRVDFGSRLRS